MPILENSAKSLARFSRDARGIGHVLDHAVSCVPIQRIPDAPRLSRTSIRPMLRMTRTSATRNVSETRPEDRE